MKKGLIDKIKIKINAGNGGDGIVSFRREKFVPKGGPDGGDGGKGGNVYFIVDHNMSTLLDFRSRFLYKAENGKSGGKKNKSGESGKDLYIKVPVGTLVYEATAEEEFLVADITGEDIASSTLLIARGGRGGKGNVHFKSATNRTPMQFTHGKPGEKKDIILEIKILADVGLIGFPNAGKSTLINVLTSANAKTGQYPFTTIMPNLGVMRLSGQDVIIADIPGLVEGASKGKGLGDEFLRHIERTRLLVHVIDPMTLGENMSEIAEIALNRYVAIRAELQNYTGGLSSLIKKPELVVINKLDITEIKNSFNIIKTEFHRKGIDVIGISAVTGYGIEVLKQRLLNELGRAPKRESFVTKSIRKYTLDNLSKRRGA